MAEEAEIRSVADTALWVAAYRADESARPDAVFRDPLAQVLAGERGHSIKGRMSGGEIMRWVMVARTTAIDRLVLRAVELGADTVLNLGAGLDTRPYRLPLKPNVRWVEVDLPPIIELKNQKLAQEQPACTLERVALDLGDAEARRRLFAEVASRSRRAAVLTEGVLPYLDAAEVSALATELHGFERFAFWIQDYYEGRPTSFMRRWRKRLQAAPIRLQVDDWFGFFSARGWAAAERILLVEEAERLGRPFPKPLLGVLMYLLTPPQKRAALRRRAGYALFTRTV
jgi:methyltransferase (TIGR00027 family)